MQGYLPITTAYAGEIVCDAIFLNPVPNAKYWYTPSETKTSITTQYNND